MTTLIDLTGKQFGYWTVQNYAGHKKWNCICTGCNRPFVVSGYALRSNREMHGCRSCVATVQRSKHGHAGRNRSPTYQSWRAMHQRCECPKCNDYAIYGGAGISVVEAWNSFDQFLKDMGHRPPGFQLDRIDGAKNYEPSNCRWISNKGQQQNRSDNKWVTCNGEKVVVREAERRMGFTRGTLGKYLRLRNWPDIEISTVPLKRRDPSYWQQLRI